MKIIIDKHIPYIKGALEEYADVEYIAGSEMTQEKVKDADALIIRTRTICNRQLLEDTKVKFIATATIGYDHIDTKYCAENGIHWTNAPGCNALSVTQYIASVLIYLSQKNRFKLSEKTIGVIGVGEVGRRVVSLAKAFGMRVLLNDPPRTRKEGDDGFVSLHSIAETADIITFHPFLHLQGEDKSYHLADKKFFDSLKRTPIIINASRGEVVETQALKRAIRENQVADVVIDTWESEPNIDLELLRMTTLATPHIAGYSADGKANASQQSVRSLSQFFNLGLDDWSPTPLAEGIEKDFSQYSVEDFLTSTYNIEADSNRMKLSPETFEKQRSDYPFRREPKAYKDRSPKGFDMQFALFFD